MTISFGEKWPERTDVEEGSDWGRGGEISITSQQQPGEGPGAPMSVERVRSDEVLRVA